jgi:DNA-binding NarL/FixJ family response regulator
MTSESVRILLADDHTIMRKGLRSILVNELHHTVVAQALNGREAVALAKEHKPDLILMDITMPDLNGIEATRQILAEVPEVKIVALSMHSDRGIVAEMLDAGASGYLLKDSSSLELEQAICTVLRNKIYISSEITDIVVRDYVQKIEAEKLSSAGALTPRERHLVQLIAEGKSTKDIAALLNISVSTVETHRQHIMEKLNLHSVAELTKYAIRAGLTSLEK